MCPSISVIIPVYNVEPYLERCIESILTQTFQDFELILVADKSKDASQEICDRYEMQYENIIVIHQKIAGAGPGPARNCGLEAASGRYVVFADADDYMECNLLKNLYDTITTEGADCAVAGCTMVYSDKTTCPVPCVKERKLFRSRDDVGELLLGSVSSLPHCALDSAYGQAVWARIYRRQLIVGNNIRFEKEFISEDIIFNIDFLRYAESAVAIPDVSYHYECGRAGSLSKGFRNDWFQREVELYNVLEKRLAEIFPRDRYTLYLQRFLIMRIAFDITQEVRYHDHVDKSYPIRKSVKKILADDMVQEALKKYPWWKLPFLRVILAGTMRFRMTELLIFLIRIQQRIMKSSQNI